MNKKIILSIIALCIVCLSLGYSMAESQLTYDVSMYMGDVIRLKNYISDHDINFQITDETVVQNMNASVLDVDQYQRIIPKDVGVGGLILSNNGQRFYLNITVESPIDSLVLGSDHIALLLGEIYQIEYTTETKEGFNKSVAVKFKWENSNPRVATISDTGEITTNAGGDVAFTGRVIGSDIEVSFNLTVNNHPNNVLIHSSDQLHTLNVGESLALSAYFGGKNITNTVRWFSATPDILKVDDKGVVTAVGEGKGEIQALSSISKKKGVYKIDGESMIDRVELNTKGIKFYTVGETFQLQFALYPKDKHNPPVLNGYRYTTSNSKIATVSSNGLITAKAPGIALITVIFDDSQKKAYCTVEVPDNYEIPVQNYVPVKKVELAPYDKNVLIGEKIPLSYTLFPENATNQKVSFKVFGGDDEQIQLIGGVYYFIPNKRGSIQIEVLASDNQKDDTTIAVTSPIDTLKLSLATRRNISPGQEKLYVGETVEVLTKITKKVGYSDADVYPSSLRYTVGDDRILELSVRGGKYHVRALKEGKTEVIVETIEGKHKYILWVRVENPVESISTDTLVRLPIGQHYQPRINSEIKSKVKDLSDFYILDELMKVSVEEFFLSEGYIDEEIRYELGVVEYYNKQTLNEQISEKIYQHQLRLTKLNELKATATDGYVLISDKSVISNRNQQPYTFYTIDGNRIVGHYPSKMEIKLTQNSTMNTASSTLICTSDQEQFSLSRLNKTYDQNALIKLYGLEQILGLLEKQEQVALLMAYMNNIELFEAMPTYEVLSSVARYQQNDALMSLITNVDDEITKGDLVSISVLLHKKYISATPSYDQYGTSHYYDVIEAAMLNAVALGHVGPKDSSYFGINETIRANEFHQMVKSVLPGYQVTYDGYYGVFTYAHVLKFLNKMSY